MRSTTPGRKFWSTTSARSARREKIAQPSGDERSTTMDRLPRFVTQNMPDMPLRLLPSHLRMSPIPGGSTFTTSAPWSARYVAVNGPESTADTSRTRTPSKGPPITTSSRVEQDRFGAGSRAALK
jgi:hypothetical protein